MDVDSSAGPTRIATEPAGTGVSPPEVIILGAEVSPGPGRPAAFILLSPSVAPEAPIERFVKEAFVIPATTQEDEPAASASIPVSTPIESAIIGGLKESLVKATQFELHLHELASEAELVKSNMHVSTYVSFLPSGCRSDFFGRTIVTLQV